MTSSIDNYTKGNSTKTKCPICAEAYENNEVENVNKVVELACRHFYHIDCISR